MTKQYTALVLQGGGALGAYEYGVIKALYEQPQFSLDVISGVSIGAFSAAVLTGATDDPVEALGELWKCFTTKVPSYLTHNTQLAMSLAYNKGMYRPNPYAWLTPAYVTHYYDVDLLYKTLKTIIDPEKLNDKSSPHLIITATNIKTGKLEIFDNREMEITFDHIVASGSLPPFFPMREVEDQKYWDGGLFSNTPLKPAFKALEKLGSATSKRELILVELFPQSGEVPNEMTDVWDRITELVFQSKIEYDEKLFKKTSEYIDLMQEIDKALPADSPIRNRAGYKKLISYKKIHKLRVFKNPLPEHLLGSADFTSETIEKRIDQGYVDGKKTLLEPETTT